MSILDGLGLRFEETMAGYLAVGSEDPRHGYELAQQDDSPIRFDVRVDIADLGAFLNLSEHTARLSGTVAFAALGGERAIESGQFNLFTIDPVSGQRRMVYAFCFKGSDGESYFLHGRKEIHDDPRAFDAVEDMTTLLTVIYRGEDPSGEVYGAGILRFSLRSAPALVGSMEVVGSTSLWGKVAAYSAFSSFAWGALRNEYLHDEHPLYDTSYENVVLSGQALTAEGQRTPFFLVSGVHDKGFPWGDTETFWDVLLLLGDGQGGWRRFAITDRALVGLVVNVEHGRLKYAGPLYELRHRSILAFSEIRPDTGGLKPRRAEIDIEFERKTFATVSFPFPTLPAALRQLSGSIHAKIETFLPASHPLGMHITPSRIRSARGRIALADQADAQPVPTLTLDADLTRGEAESAAMRSVKEPHLLYRYLCAVRPDCEESQVQIHTRALRDERQHWTKDRFEKLLGRVVTRFCSAELLMRGDALTVRRLDGDALRKQRRQNWRTSAPNDTDSGLLEVTGEPLMEVRNDHYPTGVFIRSIVEVRTPDGGSSLALEESMSLMRFEPINSSREVTVAAIRNPDVCQALDDVLDKTDFDQTVTRAISASGKPAGDFCVAIKPNFMFAYNVLDRTTYADPKLIANLALRLRGLGVGEVVVVEARSTYGQYFENRDVHSVARYFGYDGAGGAYRIVDLSEEAEGSHEFGPLWVARQCRQHGATQISGSRSPRTRPTPMPTSR